MARVVANTNFSVCQCSTEVLTHAVMCLHLPTTRRAYNCFFGVRLHCIYKLNLHMYLRH